MYSYLDIVMIKKMKLKKRLLFFNKGLPYSKIFLLKLRMWTLKKSKRKLSKKQKNRTRRKVKSLEEREKVNLNYQMML